MSSLDDPAHIRLRQRLILRLRVLVPAILLLTDLSGLAAASLGPRGLPLILRVAGINLENAVLAVALIGTVPINKDVLTGAPDSPPEDWKAVLHRWKRLDGWRAALALLGFLAFAAALFV